MTEYNHQAHLPTATTLEALKSAADADATATDDCSDNEQLGCSKYQRPMGICKVYVAKESVTGKYTSIALYPLCSVYTTHTV